MRIIKSGFLKRGYVGLCIALLSFISGIESKQLSSGLTNLIEQTKSEVPVAPVSQVTGATVQAAAGGDEYVQSEAHLQVNAVKEALAKISLHRKNEDGTVFEDSRTSNELVTPYMNIVAAAINKEVELKDSHYVFYNGCGNEWRVSQDIYKQLYAYRNPLKSVKDFIFVRFTDSPSINAQDFLQENVTKWAGVNDNIQAVRDVLVSTNLALFGGVGTEGECTWNYFLTSKSHRYPTATQYYAILKSNDMSYDLELFTKEATVLVKDLLDASPEQMLIQYCIPQDKVDQTAYLSWILGVPYERKSVALMEKWMEGKERFGGITGPIVKKVMQKIKAAKTPEDQAMYEELVAAVDRGDFGVRAFMQRYRNNPWTVKDINEIQARVLITNDIVLNPASGVKFFSYFTTPHDIQKKYLNNLGVLVKKMIDAEEGKTAEQKAADIAKNEETFARLDAAEKAERAKEKAEKEAKKAAAKAVQKAAAKAVEKPAKKTAE